MGYSVDLPPVCRSQSTAHQTPAEWDYVSADNNAAVQGAGYFTDGGSRGMKVGDIVNVLESDNNYFQASMRVTAVSTTYPGATTVVIAGS